MRGIPLVALFAGCTTLGPMPSTTGVSAVPQGRPGGEVAAGIMPIMRLSDGASGEKYNGRTNPAVSALFDPDRLLGIPGLFVTGRVWGPHGDTGVEPGLGYRRQLDDRISIGGVGYGTKMKDDENGASYKATRVGGEAMLDVKLSDLTAWSEAHLQGAVQATYIKASGRYCVQADGDATDCAEDGSVPMVDGALSGVFPAATVLAAVDFGRSKHGAFHGARLAGMFSAGWMPRVTNGEQRSGQAYITGGIMLALGFGSAD